MKSKKFFNTTLGLFATPAAILSSVSFVNKPINESSIMNLAGYDYSKVVSDEFEVDQNNITPDENVYTTLKGFYYQCDVVNPKLFPMSCFDEYVYYGKLLNDGMVRNLSLIFTIENFYLSNQALQYSINSEHSNDMRGQYTTELLPFATGSYNFITADGKYTSYYSSAFSINFSTVINQNFDYMSYSLADFVMIKYDSSTNTYKTKLNLDNVPVPTIKDKEIAFYLNWYSVDGVNIWTTDYLNPFNPYGPKRHSYGEHKAINKYWFHIVVK